MVYKLKKEFIISCSHRLKDKDNTEKWNKKTFGKCNNYPSHGHNYKVILYLKNVKLIHGMIINFSKLKEIFKSEIDDIYDHQFLNNCPGFENKIPTAENMCKIFYDILKRKIDDLYAIEIYETDGASAIYEMEIK